MSWASSDGGAEHADISSPRRTALAHRIPPSVPQSVFNGHGLSFRTVARLLGTSAQSVLRWVCGYVDQYCAKPEPGEAVVVEVDEMWHFLGCKSNRVWIWKAYDRANDRLIDWECGNRDEATFRRLFTRLERWQPRLYCTDDYVVYNNVLPVGRHYAGKDESFRLEHNNGRQRH